MDDNKDHQAEIQRHKTLNHELLFPN
jgi:hypothetical protein